MCAALKESCKPILKQQKAYQKQPQNEEQFDDIQKVFSVDSSVINFGKFICGKMLGSTFTLTNLSSSEQIVEMRVDS